MRGGAVDAPCRCQRRCAQGRFRGQGLQVIANDFRGEIVQCGLLRQAGDVLEVEAVLEAFEGLPDTPALMVKVAEFGAREVLRVEQVGHQHAYLTGAGDVPDQAHRLRRRRALVVGGVAPVRRGQRDDPVILA